jgi:hypothetical protein
MANLTVPLDDCHRARRIRQHVVCHASEKDPAVPTGKSGQQNVDKPKTVKGHMVVEWSKYYIWTQYAHSCWLQKRKWSLFRLLVSGWSSRTQLMLFYPTLQSETQEWLVVSRLNLIKPFLLLGPSYTMPSFLSLGYGGLRASTVCQKPNWPRTPNWHLC